MKAKFQIKLEVINVFTRRQNTNAKIVMARKYASTRRESTIVYIVVARKYASTRRENTTVVCVDLQPKLRLRPLTLLKRKLSISKESFEIREDRI